MAAFSGGQLPPDPDPQGQQAPDHGDQQPQGPPGPPGPQGQPQSFADAAGRNSKQSSKYIYLHLHREDRNISFTLSRKEKAALVFRRLKLHPSQIIRIEMCKFEVIRIEVVSTVNVENYKTTAAMQIIPGLKVKPMKELKRSTRIKVCWVQSEVPNKEIVSVLSMYGKVVSEPEDLYFELSPEEENDSELVGMKSIKNGERAVEIEIMRNIPSYVKIAGQRARIWYKGQNYYCSRCYRSFRSCPGKADRKECLRLKGVERDFEDFWAEQLSQKLRKERLDEDDKFDTDMVDLSRVPDGVEKEELLNWLSADPRCITVDEGSLSFSGFRGTWRLTGIKTEEIMRVVVERLHGAKIRGKPILCLPIKQNTPAKPPPTRENPEEEAEGMETSDGVETQEERNTRIRKEQAETAEAVERERQRLTAELREKEEQRLAAEQAAALSQKKDEDQAAALNPGSGAESTEDAVHGERREERGEGEDPERTRRLVGLGPEMAALESSAYNTEVSVSNQPSTTSNITNMIKSGLTSFGIIKPKGQVNINNSGSAVVKPSAPLDPKPQRIRKIPPNPERAKTTINVLASETPVAAAAIKKNKTNFVEETPAIGIEASPKLKDRKEDLTLGSDDEIFTATLKPFSPSDLGKMEFGSEFARRLSGSGRDLSAINIGAIGNRTKRKSIYISSTSSSDASATKPSPEKSKPAETEEKSDDKKEEKDEPKTDEEKKTPDKKAEDAQFEVPMTKGQKKKERERRKRLRTTGANKHNKF